MSRCRLRRQLTSTWRSLVVVAGRETHVATLDTESPCVDVSTLLSIFAALTMNIKQNNSVQRWIYWLIYSLYVPYLPRAHHSSRAHHSPEQQTFPSPVQKLSSETSLIKFAHVHRSSSSKRSAQNNISSLNSVLILLIESKPDRVQPSRPRVCRNWCANTPGSAAAWCNSTYEWTTAFFPVRLVH